jgi:hypothetical protein
MRQRLFGFGGWLAAVLAMATAAVAVQAQSSGPQSGAFVQAQDGSLWVVANGTRVGITAAPDRDNTLTALPEGPHVATVDELNAALAASAPPSGPPQAPAVFVDYTFTARGQSPTFFAEGRVEVCWEFTPSGMAGSMTLNPEGSSFWVDGGFFNGISRSGCRAVDLTAAQYYLDLNILQSSRGVTTSLRVIVRPAR